VHRDARWQSLVVVYAALVLVQYALPLDPVASVIVDVVVIARATKLLRAVETPADLPNSS
jgi:hypothetical protein